MRTSISSGFACASLSATALAAALLTAAACSSSSSQSNKSSGAGDIKYSLVEASGELSVVGGGKFQGCISNTTLSKYTFSLPAPKLHAATFDPERGKLAIQTPVTITYSGLTGEESCNNKPPVDCSPGHTKPNTADQLLSLLDINFGKSPADGLAFRPNLKREIGIPEMCRSQDWKAPNNWFYGKPITVQQLKSGRFVIENAGTAARMQEFEPDGSSDGPVNGTFTWSYRFVFQADNHDPANAVASTEFGNFDECLDGDAATTADDLEAAQAAFSRGDTDIPMSATGCRRLSVSRKDGVVTTRMQLTKGTKYIVDATTGKSVAARDTVDTYVREVDANGERERIDADADGFAEQEGETKSAGSDWVSTVTRQVGKASSPVVLEQITETRLDATTMRVRFEKNGKITNEYEASIQQARCFDPTTPTAYQCRPPLSDGTTVAPHVSCTEDMLTACSPTAMKQINKLLAKTIEKGSKCLRKFSPDRADGNGKALVMLASGGIKFVCPSAKCDDFGHLNRATKNLMLNLDKSGSGESLQSTIFHELLHLDPNFNHDDGLVEVSAKACKLPIAVRAYACEDLCFGPPGQACQDSCRRCINPGKPDCESDSCSELPQCSQRREPLPDGSWRPWYDWTKPDPNLISRSVGAYCPSTKTFCDTASECRAECGGIACKPFKTTCSGNCN